MFLEDSKYLIYNERPSNIILEASNIINGTTNFNFSKVEIGNSILKDCKDYIALKKTYNQAYSLLNMGEEYIIKNNLIDNVLEIIRNLIGFSIAVIVFLIASVAIVTMVFIALLFALIVMIICGLFAIVCRIILGKKGTKELIEKLRKRKEDKDKNKKKLDVIQSQASKLATKLNDLAVLQKNDSDRKDLLKASKMLNDKIVNFSL